MGLIGGAAAFAVANAAVLLGAHALLRRIASGRPGVDVVVFLLLRFLIVSCVVLAAGLAGALGPAWLGGAGALALAALLAAGEHRRLPAFRSPGAGVGFSIVAALLLLRGVLQVWFFAPHLGDVTSYHLPKVAEWVRAGGFTAEMGVHTHVTFPAGFELVETWWVVFFRHDALVEAAGLEFLFLGAASAWALAARIGLPERGRAFAALAYALSPGFHLSASSGLNDAPSAALVVATAAVVAGGAPWIAALVAFGLGTGLKPTYGFAVPGLLLLAWGARKEERPRAGAPAALGLGAAALAAGTFWYLRNAVVFGNPFYPLGSAGFVDPTPVQFGPKAGSLWANFSDLVNLRIADHRGAYGANVDHIAGWGPVAFALGLPGLALLVRHRELRRLAAGFAVSLAGTLAFSQNDQWCLKYAFYFPALLCLAAAAWCETSSMLRPVGLAALAFSFLATFLPYDLPRSDLSILAAQSWRSRSAAALPNYGAEHAEAAVGYFGEYSGREYLLYRPDFSARVVYLRSRSASRLVEEARASGVRRICGGNLTASQREILEEAERRGDLAVEGNRWYRVKP